MSDETVSTGPKVSYSMATQVEYVQGANIGRFYTNHVQANVTMFEVRLHFNFVTGLNPATNKLQGLEAMLVSMSPELAGGLLALLARALETYQHDYRPLATPKPPEPEATESEPGTES